MVINLNPPNQFIIENDILIDIPIKIISYSRKYYPKRGTLEEFNTYIHGKTKGFCYHYIIDEQLLGVNCDRNTEKKVFPLETEMKLSNDNYYTDFDKNVYGYNNKNGLYLLICKSYDDIFAVNLDFKK